MGVLNGIDPELWDPEEDAWLPMPYNADTCDAGKAAARAELRRRLNLSPHDDRLVVAVVSRLTGAGRAGWNFGRGAAWEGKGSGRRHIVAPPRRIQPPSTNTDPTHNTTTPPPRQQQPNQQTPTGQKGVHLIKHAAWRARDRGGQFVLLGSAPDPKVQGEFDALAGQLSGSGDAAFCFFYDEPLSHLIYAAADIVVVPSMFEPCGLTQMIAMR